MGVPLKPQEQMDAKGAMSLRLLLCIELSQRHGTQIVQQVKLKMKKLLPERPKIKAKFRLEAKNITW